MWCPGPGCHRICVTNGLDLDNKVADGENCGTQFCTVCSEECYAPASCDQKKWIAKNRDESETVNWMLVNTKNCPKRGVRAEKSGHITCRKCGDGFCWVCGGTHHVWDCNANKEEQDEADETVRAKHELERYMYYHKRYKGHDDAQQFARGQLNASTIKEKKAEDTDEKNMADASSSNSCQAVVDEKIQHSLFLTM